MSGRISRRVETFDRQPPASEDVEKAPVESQEGLKQLSDRRSGEAWVQRV